MKLDLAHLPLPTLAVSDAGPHRRHHIGHRVLGGRALRRFERAAAALGAAPPPPWGDALACAARRLEREFVGTRRAPCIRLRLRCLAAMQAMAVEPAWSLAGAARERIATIADYARCPERLVPDEIPVVGGLDDAVLVDLAWPALRFELDDYLDFRRLRAEEAQLRGVPAHRLMFGREEWLAARAAEHALRAHVRRRGLECYPVASAPALFGVRG
ncbi:hypothetical protein [Dokdonella fugitiva]|uniref:DUF1232 domain-containing protein n=1 Tax=Dokdonella fugitiva TaxID=328517 RepID=A0A4R2IAN1_9GAMM|nr:hypothetical protein [Dokdonella fugitiva]TCO40458.1 hypothetical protein EV148_105256 [Dokdonella fugitiva]